MWRSNFYFLRVQGVSKRSNQFKKAIYLKVMSIEACGKFLNTILVFTCKPYNVLKCSVFPLPDRHMSTQQSNSLLDGTSARKSMVIGIDVGE